MRIFMTGASGWIGSATAAALIERGHEVTGLARSEQSAAALTAAGITPHAGSLDDLDSLRTGAAASDGVVHLGFKHDYSDMAASGRTDRAVLEAFGDVLAGSDRPLLLASGAAGLTPGRITTENDRNPSEGPDSMRGGGENLALSFADRGVRSVALRFAPTVHGPGGDHGFIATIAQAAVRSGQSAYIGDGANRWPAVNRADAAELVALALEGATPGSVVHVVAEEGIATKDVAEAVGSALGLPVESIHPDAAGERFGWVGRFFALDTPASSLLTRERLGWEPVAPGLLADIASGYYTP
ncbi:SDR family oxidoreductase [Glaciihabitans arcticus]|uniref:SDR family oxidoreductase n=1 Tax=Glaciihabitans arcticus TaxID=2668039 RepID=A0A4Q9GZ19_9MICO|nr:SDR family oxidoreductase [Glaciihabitans arcticus]TBN58073.1 SDR family oxidoreductase [Glaciihabitans arcticus]